MAEEMKMRATMQGDVVDVKVLIQHIMETGQRKDQKTGNLIPAHFINQVSATLNGKAVLEMQWGVGIARNPFIGFRVKGAKAGDKVAVHAVDNLGATFDGEVVVA
jgi:sulfur-oxidizing protein SoxZ